MNYRPENHSESFNDFLDRELAERAKERFRRKQKKRKKGEMPIDIKHGRISQ